MRPGPWENRESRLSGDEGKFAGQAGKGHSRQREQLRKGSEASVNERCLVGEGWKRLGDTRAASPSTPGRTGVRVSGLRLSPCPGTLGVTRAGALWSQLSLLP